MEDLSDKAVRELFDELKSLRKQLVELSLKKCSGGLPKSHVISETRKQIARVYTFLGQKTCQERNN